MAGRPEKKQPRVMLTVRIGAAGVDALRRGASRRGLSQSEAIREALAEWCRRNT